MNRHRFSIYLLILILFPGGIVWMKAQEQKKKLTIDDIFVSHKFKGETVENIHWLPDGSAFTFTRETNGENTPDIYRYHLKSGREALILRNGRREKSGGIPLSRRFTFMI
jgi:hypothetical protein